MQVLAGFEYIPIYLGLCASWVGRISMYCIYLDCVQVSTGFENNQIYDFMIGCLVCILVVFFSFVL